MEQTSTKLLQHCIEAPKPQFLFPSPTSLCFLCASWACLNFSKVLCCTRCQPWDLWCRVDRQREGEGWDVMEEICLESMALLSSLYPGCGERLLPEIIFRQGWSFNPGLAQCTKLSSTLSNPFGLFLSARGWFVNGVQHVSPTVYEQNTRDNGEHKARGRAQTQRKWRNVMRSALMGQVDTCDVVVVVLLQGTRWRMLND